MEEEKHEKLSMQIFNNFLSQFNNRSISFLTFSAISFSLSCCAWTMETFQRYEWNLQVAKNSQKISDDDLNYLRAARLPSSFETMMSMRMRNEVDWHSELWHNRLMVGEIWPLTSSSNMQILLNFQFSTSLAHFFHSQSRNNATKTCIQNMLLCRVKQKLKKKKWK